MRYGDLIGDAFRIAWRNRFLWFFGFFVSLSSFPSGGGGGNPAPTTQPQDFDFGQSVGDISSVSSGVVSDPASTLGSAFSAVWTPLLVQANDSIAFLILALAVIILLIFIIFVALNLISQAALADGVSEMKSGGTRRFGQSFGIGLSFLLRLLLQAILFFLIGLALLIVIAVVAGLPILLTFLLSQSVGLRIAMSVIFGIIGVLLLLVIFISLAIISQLAIRELVVGGSGITSSIGAAYRLFRARLGSVLLVWLLNIALKIGLAIALFIAALLVGLILVGPGIGIAAAGAENAGLIVGIIGGIVFLAISFVVLGAIGTFIHAYWTLAYLQLTDRDAPPPPQTQPAPL